MKIPVYASDEDYDTLITDDYILKDDQGNNLIVYKKIDVDFELINSKLIKLLATRKKKVKVYLEYYFDIVNGFIAEYFPGKYLAEEVYYNINASMEYHLDVVNADNSVTTTLCYKQGTEGGYLVFPDLRLALAQDHGYICIFDGQMLKHGVTDIVKLTPEGKRISYIFFT